MNPREEKNMTSPIIDKEAKILAEEFFEKLQEAGLCSRDVLSISTQLIGIATDNIPAEKQARS